MRRWARHALYNGSTRIYIRSRPQQWVRTSALKLWRYLKMHKDLPSDYRSGILLGENNSDHWHQFTIRMLEPSVYVTIALALHLSRHCLSGPTKFKTMSKATTVFSSLPPKLTWQNRRRSPSRLRHRMLSRLELCSTRPQPRKDKALKSCSRPLLTNCINSAEYQ